MIKITFRRTAEGEARILADGKCVSDHQRRSDILKPKLHYYVIHLIKDPRGPVPVQERSRVREVTRTRVASHPYW